MLYSDGSHCDLTKSTQQINDCLQESWKEEATNKAHIGQEGTRVALALHPTKRILAVAFGHLLTFYDLKTNSILKTGQLTKKEDFEPQTRLNFNKDGSRLIAATSFGKNRELVMDLWTCTSSTH